MAELPKYMCFRVVPKGLEVYIERVEPEEVAEDLRPVRRGRWVKKNDSPLDGEYWCSNCKQEIDIADGEETPLNRGMNYCPSCGADMRGGDAE